MTHLCINCNAPQVKRTGDRFTCDKCHYTWTVAHEQANAAYLRSQGRQPARPAGDEPAASMPTDDLMVQLGLVKDPAPTVGGPVEGGTVYPVTKSHETDEAIPSGELPGRPSKEFIPEDWQDEPDQEHIEATLNAEFVGDDDELVIDTDVALTYLEKNHTVADLETLAADHDVDLSGTSRKADIIDRLLESGTLTFVFDDNGSVADVR